MKEFSSNISDGFTGGLRPLEWTPINSQYMTLLQNCRSLGKDGLSPIEPLTTPVGLALTVAHPFPQIFKGVGVTLVADSTAIYQVDESTWTMTQITTYEEYASGTAVLTNAYFTGNANSWTLGTNWAYSGNSVTHSVGFAGSLTQAVADQATPLVSGKVYDVTISVKVDETVTLPTGSGVRINMGTGSHSLYFNASGRYRIMMVASGTMDFSIDATADFQGQVDFIHLRELKTASITAGGAWQFLDMNTNWMLFNGSCTVAAYIKGYARVFSTVGVKTGCYHRGRAIIGGLNDKFFTQGTSSPAEEGFNTFLDYLNSKVVDGIAYDAAIWERNHQGKNWIAWSSIGGGDVWNFLYPQFAIYGYYGATESEFGAFVTGEDILTRSHELWFDMIQRNEAGMMPMPFQGEVKLTLPLGKNFVVYGEDGVCGCYLVSEPIATYGMKPLLKVGIAARCAAAGNDDGHIFIDTRGNLWFISPTLETKQIGHKEFLSGWLGDNITVSYEESLQLFWLSNGAQTYTWSTYGGLAGPNAEIPTSVVFADGGSVGYYSTDATIPDVKMRTDAIDFGLRAIKKIESLEIASNDNNGVYAMVEYRYAASDTWSSTQWIKANNYGSAYIGICGVEFRFNVKTSWDATVAFPSQKISNVTVRWKLNDKRAIRGIYAAKD